MLGRVSYLAGAATLAIMVAAPAMAQDKEEAQASTSADDSTSDAEDIVVLGQKLEESTPETLEKYGSRLEIVEGEAIDKAGYVDTSSALRNLVPGLYIGQKSGAFDYVQASLTGSRTSEVLFLVDGVRINNRLYASTTPLDTIPAGMIERIEVLKGGQSLYYGTQAVGGIVNVVTKSFTREPDGRLEIGYDTNDGYHGNGYFRGGVGDHYFVAFGSYDEAKGFQPFRDEDTQPSALDRNRGYKVASIGGKYAFEPSDNFRLSTSYQHIEGRLDFAKAEDIYRNWNKRNEDIASLKIDWSPAENFDVYVKGYWHDWDSTYLDLRPEVVGGALTGNIITINDGEMWGFDDKGINVLGEFHANDQFTLVGGYDFQTYSGFDDVFLIAPSSESVHAPFAQVKFDSGDLSLAAGVRYNAPDDGQDATVWNVSGRYGASEGFYGRGQVGTSFRLPTAYELYVIDPCCERGNPDLVGEESFNVEGGVGYTNDMLNAELMGFYRKVDNLIGITYDLPAYPDGFIINTPEKVTMWGGEAVVTAQLSKNFGGTLDWTHTEATPAGSDLQLVNIPRDLVKAIFNAQTDDGRFGGTASVNYVGDIFANVAAVGRVNYGNYAVVDVAAYAFIDREQHHRIGVRLENLLDADYNTQMTRVRDDVTNASYAAGFRGTPRTLHVTYSVSL